MKMKLILGTILLVAGFGFSLFADEKDSGKQTEKAVKERLHKKAVTLLDLAETMMNKGQHKYARTLIEKARAIEKHNERAAKLKKVNEAALAKIERQEIIERYKQIRDRSLDESLKSLEKSPDHIQRQLDRNETAKKPGDKKWPGEKKTDKKKENDWSAPFLKALDKNYHFKEEGTGKQLIKKIAKLFAVNVVVDAEVRLMETFKEELEIDYRHMNGKNLLHNLCRQWGVHWYLENQALVISKNKPQAKAAANQNNFTQNRQMQSNPNDPFKGDIKNFGILGFKDSWGNDIYEQRGLNIGGMGVYSLRNDYSYSPYMRSRNLLFISPFGGQLVDPRWEQRPLNTHRQLNGNWIPQGTVPPSK